MRASLLTPVLSGAGEHLEAPVLDASRHPERGPAVAHRLIARALLGGLAVQLFFAGLGVFNLASFALHAAMGTAIVLASFSLPILAWRGHLDRSTTRLSWLLAGLMLTQGLLIDVGRVIHIVSALHPVNAMLLILVTFKLATRDI